MELPLLDVSTTPPSERDRVSLRPGKIVGVGRNYRSHAQEMSAAVPAEPLLFLKATSALCPPGGDIVRPAYDRVDYEGELGVVIGRRARRVTPDQALGYVLGYTCVNDVTVRDLQKRDGQWARAKSFDTCCPIGPRIVTGVSPDDLRIETRVNGEPRQSARTSDMVFSVATLIAHISQFATLEPHDVIASGTPSGVGNLSVGDVVEVEIESVGVLRNRVVADG